MERRSWARALLLSLLAVACAADAGARDYPDKPIRIVVPYPPGGTTDALARLIAEGLTARWGQPVIIDNRAGAGGNIGAELFARSAPDGYTLLLASPGPFAINKNLYARIGYEPAAFTPISLVASTPNVLVVPRKEPFKTLPELVSAAKAAPDRYAYASQGAGSTSHLTGEWFKSAAAVKVTHVPYKGSGPAIVDLLAGQVDMMFVELSTVLGQIRGGTLRVLAVGSEQRQPAFPNVPAVAETLPGFASTTWFALAAPPDTPPALADRLSAAVAEIVRQPATRKKLADMNISGVGGTPAEMAAFVAQETDRWRRVIKATGATVD